MNECVQARTLARRCNDRLTTLYEYLFFVIFIFFIFRLTFFFRGDSFYFAQYIFTMEQFRTESITIDIPKATVIFPKGFDSQIARVSFYFLCSNSFCSIFSFKKKKKKNQILIKNRITP